MYSGARILKLNNKLKELNGYFEVNDEILTVYIFGSYGTEQETGLSDIDFGVLYKKQPSLMEELKIEADLGRIMEEEDIDLVSLNRANIDLKYNIINTGTKIYEVDDVKTADFIEFVLKQYFDFGIKLKRIKKDFRDSLEEEYADGS